ncbi:MAG: winged helix-turn-helix transcriptional regulator [archaeon]|nr:MAG: winged helix-turn-helix transcriptional regulator [archaeon]
MSSFSGLPKFVTSSEVRRKLLGHLAKEAMTPTELASIEKKHISHVSRALAELKAQGLVEPVFAQSREKYYRATHHGLSLYQSVLNSPK